MGRSVAQASESGVTERAPVSSALSASSSCEKLGFLQRMDEFDKQLSLRVHGAAMVVPRWILKLLELSGDGLLVIPLAAALWLAPILLEKDDLRSFLFNLFVAFILDLPIIGLMKGIFRRPRPVYNKGMHVVVSLDHYSFPSGHSSRALMIAAFVGLNFSVWRTLLATRAPLWEDMLQSMGLGMQGYVPSLETCFAIALWSWASATAASRILLGRHYVFDVLVGSLLGIVEALIVHHVLFVPKHVSQGIHDFVLGLFKKSWIMLGLSN